MTPRTISVILNPKSGKAAIHASPEQLRARLAARGDRVFVETLGAGAGVGELVSRALARPSDIVVAAGGDGTIRSVAEALAGKDVPLAVLARGTFNYVSRSLDQPEDEAAAIAAILDGTPVAMQAGRINGRLFLNNTSLGRYPEILANREGAYKRWGRSRLAAYWSVLTTLLTLRRPLRLEIDADGQRHSLRTPLIFVLNNAYQMRQMGLHDAGLLAEGKLVMYVSPDTGRLGLLRQALALALGVAQKGRDFHVIAARRFLIRSRRRRHRVALDGERQMLAAPLTIEADASALWVVAPTPALPQQAMR